MTTPVTTEFEVRVRGRTLGALKPLIYSLAEEDAGSMLLEYIYDVIAQPVPTGETDADGAPVTRDPTPEEAIKQLLTPTFANWMRQARAHKEAKLLAEANIPTAPSADLSVAIAETP